MKKFLIWNKKDQILTPSGEVYTASQWIEKHPVAGFDTISIVCSAGEVNGAFFGVLSQMKQMREQMGADFSDCTSDEEILEAIEAFDDELNAQDEQSVSNEELTATSLASIAASLEFQNMMSLEDAEVV